MMYGFGDQKTPLKESVDVVEQMVREYMISVSSKMVEVSHVSGELDIGCLSFVVRHDSAKSRRIQELMELKKEIMKHRKSKLDNYDDDDDGDPEY